MQQATYEETLDKMEEFMEKTGLRDFCTKVCQGYCCQVCFTSSTACHRNEGRRLSCSVFLCFSLGAVALGEAEKVIYDDLRDAIISKLAEIMSHKTGAHKDVYFGIHNESVRQAFSIKQKVLDTLLKINVEAVKHRLSSLRHLHSISSRFLVNKLQKRGKNGHR